MGFRYTSMARWLHWIVAILLIGQAALGLLADSADPPLLWRYLDAHVQLGITIFGFMVLRLVWRIGHPPPPLPEGTPRRQVLIASVVHKAIYALVLFLPVSGYALWIWDQRPLHLYGLIPIPLFDTGTMIEAWRSLAGYAHEWGFYALCGLLALHVGAALWHEMVLGDRLVRERMM